MCLFIYRSVSISIVLNLAAKTPWAVIVTSAERSTLPLEVKASTTNFGRVNWEMERWRKIASDTAKGLCFHGIAGFTFDPHFN